VDTQPTRARQQRKGSITFKPQVELPPELEELRNRDISPDVDSAAERALNIAASLAQIHTKEAIQTTSPGRRGSLFQDNEHEKRVEVLDFRILTWCIHLFTLVYSLQGREIQQDHAQYALTYGMMLGIRVCVSYCCRNIKTRSFVFEFICRLGGEMLILMN
jgi:hypothetical protein